MEGFGLHGSTGKKHGRCGGSGEDQEEQFLKAARGGGEVVREHALFPGGGEQMVSFSSLPPPPQQLLQHLKNAAILSGGSSMHGAPPARVKGPFTLAQWMELEQQVHIYQCIVANNPLPASITIPLKRSFSHSGFPCFSNAAYGSNTLGWGSLHMGYPGYPSIIDPEPGRCRRTDGKKWRCSRDAVSDQKYCERHLNRGRHRSRKHVEGSQGHAAKALSATSSGALASASNNLNVSMQADESLAATNPVESCATELDRIFMSKGDLTSSPTMNYTPYSVPSIMNQKTPDTVRSSKTDGFPSNTAAEQDFTRSNLQISFLTDSQYDEHSQYDRIQLSISIPTPALDLATTSSSLNPGKLSLSPLRSSPDDDQLQMGLGVGISSSVLHQEQPSWVPISWESSIGGPLGEVFTNNRTTKDEGTKCSPPSLSLLPGSWISSSQLHLSPTGVLQRGSFGSVSSSTASSPRAENNAAAHSILCSNTLLAPASLSTRTIPLL